MLKNPKCADGSSRGLLSGNIVMLVRRTWDQPRKWIIIWYGVV